MKYIISIFIIFILLGCSHSVRSSFKSPSNTSMCYYMIEDRFAHRSVIYDYCDKYKIGDEVK